MSTVLISGASGFLGSALAAELRARGDRVVALVRTATAHPDGVRWDPGAGTIDAGALASSAPDVVVHLAGEPIGQRWTPERRRLIRDSRVRGTDLLASTLARLSRRPATLLSGSAIGFYGANRGDEMLDESSSAGTDFLATTAAAWEAAAAPAAGSGIRTVLVRTGNVLSPAGGALKKMLLPFQLGVGGRLGDGRQWMSWIGLTDYVRALMFLIDTAALQGPVNVVAPEPVRNEGFTAALAGALGRPALLPVPPAAMALVFTREMVDNTVLASQRVIPNTLAGAGFEFRHPRVDDALRYELKR